MAAQDQRTRSEDGTPQESAQRSTKHGRRRFEGLSTAALVTLIGAILAAVISGTNLTFELWPGLKPDPKEKVGASLAVLRLDKNVEYGDYRKRVTQRETREPIAEHPGNVFYLRAQIEGFKRETLHLKWFTYDPNGERRATQGGGRSEDSVFEPGAPINTQVAQVWVREPGQFVDGLWEPDPGVYFVRFELYSRDILLALEDSPRFSVEG
jgi:hypothetical protein